LDEDEIIADVGVGADVGKLAAAAIFSVLCFVSFGLVLIFVGRLLDIATLWKDGGGERATKIRCIYVLGLSHYIPFSSAVVTCAEAHNCCTIWPFV